MSETRRKFNRDFREGAVRLGLETGKPIAQVARDLGINEGTLGNWVARERRARGEGKGALSEDERAELARLRRENAELQTLGAPGRDRTCDHRINDVPTASTLPSTCGYGHTSGV